MLELAHLLEVEVELVLLIVMRLGSDLFEVVPIEKVDGLDLIFDYVETIFVVELEILFIVLFLYELQLTSVLELVIFDVNFDSGMRHCEQTKEIRDERENQGSLNLFLFCWLNQEKWVFD